MNSNGVLALGGKVLGLSLSMLLAACGGIVSFNGQADGGSGGDGGNGANGGNGGSPPGPGPTTTGPIPICETLCSQFPSCLGGGDCQSVCNSFYVAGCESESELYLQCVANNLSPDCDFPEGACFMEINALEACQNKSDCTTDSCNGGAPDCYCTGTCEVNGGTAFVEQACFGFFGGEPAPAGSTGAAGVGGGGGGNDAPGNEMQCDCYVDGQYITTCFNSSFQCGLEEGCCQQFL